MKNYLVTVFLALSCVAGLRLSAQQTWMNSSMDSTKRTYLFLDMHQLEPGKVKYEAVAGAHAKDLAVQGKYNVNFLKYWVDEKKGMVFCLASAPDSESIRKAHAEAHGLLPERIFPMTEGMEAAMKANKNLFLDIHYLGAGNVTKEAVAGAHQKDLATQKKYGVNFVDYWVDEKEGVVMCLAQAKDSASMVQTHKEAHGLLPQEVFKVKQGQ